MLYKDDIVLVDCSNCISHCKKGRAWFGVVREILQGKVIIEDVDKIKCICPELGFHFRGKRLRINSLVRVVKAPKRHGWMRNKEALIKWISEEYNHVNRSVELSYILEINGAPLWDCWGFPKDNYILKEVCVQEIKVNRFRVSAINFKEGDINE